MKYIALLRGINVGGQKKIKMSELIGAFESLGFKNVTTYIQSGNAIFDYEMVDILKLAALIEEKINQTFGFQVKTLIRTKDEMESIIKNNPFTNKPDVALDKLHVTFLSDVPAPGSPSNFDMIKEQAEEFSIISREVYLYCPNGYGNTKLNNTLFEKKLKTTATTRNWKTVNTLFDMSNQ